MIKICDNSIVDPLCCIFERCLETGIYPSQWKKANIIPVHIKGCKQNKRNYRPISLLPSFGKFLVKLLFDAIYEHLCINGLISPHQSGFRPGDSTIDQLLLITQIFTEPSMKLLVKKHVPSSLTFQRLLTGSGMRV